MKILITGTAQGIGKAIAQEFLNKGHEVNGFDIKNSSIDHPFYTHYKVDISQKDKLPDIKDVNILINNAAIDLSNLFHLKTADDFRRTFDVNVIGAYNCAKSVYRHMLEKEYGRIINISSTNGVNTYYPMCIDYDASKAALNSLTHDLAFEMGPYVHVNAIIPGFIGTESELDGYDEEFLKEETDKIMIKRYGDPKEVAYLVKFLISEEADYINNTVIRIDGGQVGSC